MGKMTVAIIGEGITEKYYLQSLQDIDDICKVKYYPAPTSSTKGFEKAIHKAVSDGYTQIYCMIDMDIQYKDPSSLKKYICFKNKYHNKRNKKYDLEYCVQFFESYPCTEIFFRYYFEFTTAEQTNEGVKKWLNTRFGYIVHEKYFAHTPLHATLCKNGGNLNNAITSSIHSIDIRIPQNTACCYTELGHMINLLMH